MITWVLQQYKVQIHNTCIISLFLIEAVSSENVSHLFTLSYLREKELETVKSVDQSSPNT